MLDDPLLPQPGNLGTREFEQLSHHLVGRVAERRPKIGDAPWRLGQRGDDVGHDYSAEPFYFHFRKVAARLEMFVLEDIGNAVELANGHLPGNASLQQFLAREREGPLGGDFFYLVAGREPLPLLAVLTARRQFR